MNSGCGGSQLEMHPTNIKQEVGCLVPHEDILEVRYENHMIFQQGGDVIFWIIPQDRVDMKFSYCDDPQLKYKTQAELHGNLKSAGVGIYIVKGNRVDQLQDISHKNDICNKENK